MALSNFYWDSGKPVNGTLIPDGPQAWRYLVGNTATLFASEHHTFPTTTNIGAWHLPGSAVAFYESGQPTTRIDGTSFDSNDLGRLAVDSDDGQAYVLTADTPTWTSLSAYLLATANTWALAQTFSKPPVFSEGVVANNTALSARNAADDGNVEMIRVDGSDVVTLPDGVVATTQSASDDSTKVATTAYADALATESTDGFNPTSEADTAWGTGVTTLPNGFKMAWGSKSVAVGESSAVTPSGFSIIYDVQLTLSQDSSADWFAPKIGNMNDTNFTIWNTTGGTVAVRWRAIGR